MTSAAIDLGHHPLTHWEGPLGLPDFARIEDAAFGPVFDAALKGGTEQVTVKFLSKLISATHDKEGKVIDGDPVHVSDVTDIWTFARETTSRDPNWKLIATESVE